ncbi:hypothetical protein GE061_017197 [Apolygus lucorum]|uniref:Uncharacterized protein n=1 Tax=Apolygus lucorum TaxID=248454 RepID=A0A8S9XAI5_APOLU|nr:hypothetical protein GE061_017197 [Apolygus lucorum]
MEVYKIAVILCAIGVPSYSKVYYFCDLARRLKFKYYPQYVQNVSLATCIAGYRGYDTSHKLIHPNGRIYYGIFGLESKNSYCNKGEFMDDYLGRDLECLAAVLSEPRMHYMYERLCAPDLTARGECWENDYFKVDDVWIPLFPDIFDETYGEEHAIVRYLKTKGIDYNVPFGVKEKADNSH